MATVNRSCGCSDSDPFECCNLDAPDSVVDGNSRCDCACHKAREPRPPRPGFRLVECTGAAHSNPFIDNCLTCAPRWGWIEIPLQFETREAYADACDAAALRGFPIDGYLSECCGVPVTLGNCQGCAAQGNPDCQAPSYICGDCGRDCYASKEERSK